MHLSYLELKHLWIVAGGSPSEANVAASVAMAESHGNNQAFNASDPYGGSRCAWQINGVHPFDAHVLREDPYYCALAANYVRHKQGWNAWSTHADKTYLKFMPHAHHHHVGRVAHHAHAVHVKPADTSYASVGMGCFGLLLVVNTLLGKLKEAIHGNTQPQRAPSVPPRRRSKPSRILGARA